ncbi:MAG: cytochrome b/b6 domain-containing protein [Bacteroidota bacterium]
MSAEGKLYLYPLWLRIWHGVNAISIIVLILSGISMHYSTTIFLLKFENAVAVHNVFGVILALNYILFFAGNLLTKNGMYYQIKMRGLQKRLMKQVKYYVSGMFKGEKTPYPISEKRKFNPLQKYSYIIVMYIFVPVVIITGLALLFPEIIIDEIYQVSGVMLTAILHSIVGFFIMIFLFVHLYVASMGKSPVNNFKSIVTGWHHA